jgi:hypothetical protein
VLISRVTGNGSGHPQLRIVEVSLSHNTVPIYQVTEALPYTGSLPIDGILFSPNGRYIEMTIREKQLSPLTVLLHRARPSYRPHRVLLSSLWVCRADGRDLHEVGHITCDLDDQTSTTLSDVQWMPDSKRLSFEYADALWTVAVE